MTGLAGTIETPNRWGGTAATARPVTPKIGASMPAQRTCSEDGCDERVDGRGLCKRHYGMRRWRGTLPPLATTEDRFWEKVEERGSCWEWTGYIMPCGYGQARVNGKTRLTHRTAYEWVVGVVPEGLVLDHLCRNRACCNPAHLEAVTQLENVRRGIGGWNTRGKTHCPSGHPYDEENTYVNPAGSRVCRSCMNARTREYKRRKRAEGVPW